MANDTENIPPLYLNSNDNPAALFCVTERIFIDPSSSTTYEFVFPLHDDTTANVPGFSRKNLPPASVFVKNNLPPLINAARCVGKLFVMAQSKETEIPYVWLEGTAFYVASDIIATAAHTLFGSEHDIRFIFFSTSVYADTSSIESALMKATFPLDGLRSPTKAEIDELGKVGFWLASPLPGVSPGTQRIAYETEEVPNVPGKRQWRLRFDFAFLKVPHHSSTYFLPRTGVDTGSAVLIAYAGLLDTKDLEMKYKGAGHPAPSPYKLKTIFGSFDRKFISPGEIAESNAFFANHTANAEACSSGAPVLLLRDEFTEPLLFSGIHVGSLNLSLGRNHMVHTMHKAFKLEWAIRVLPAISTTLPTSALRRQSLANYITAVLEDMPADWPETALAMKLLGQLQRI